MKSKLYYLLWLLAIMPIAFLSCDDNNDYEEATLEVSANPVSFAKAGGEQTVEITTNRDKWVASSPLESSWLTLTQSGTQLTVKAAVNAEGVERKGYILVNAGDATAKINVTQSAGDIYLNISTETAAFGIEGGEQRIDVVSNGTFNVEVEEAAKAWLNASYMEGTTYFTLTAAENAGAEARAGKVYVTAGSVTKEVAVSQEAKVVERVLLPFMGNPSTIGKISQFEQARGSAIIKVPDGLFNANQYHFATSNDDFPVIIYACKDAYSNYAQALTATEDKTLCEGAEFEAFMTAKGFEKKGDGTYAHKEFPYTLTITIEGDGATILANYTPKQGKPYPTFKEIPLKLQMTWTSFPEVDQHGEKYSVVEAWEAEQGSKLDEETSALPTFAWFTPAASETNFVARAYWMLSEADGVPADYYDEITSVRATYDKVDLVFWMDGTTAYVTDEFAKLLSDAGFTYYGVNKQYQVYSDKNSNMILFGIVQFSDFMPGTTLLDFQSFKMEIDDSSAVSLVTNMDKRIEFFKKIDQKMRMMEETQPLKVIK